MRTCFTPLKLSGDAYDLLQVLRAARRGGLLGGAGRPDGLQRLMVVSGRLPANTGGGPVHAHVGDEVLNVVSGEIIVRVGAERRTCGPGDVAVVPPNVLHGFKVVQDTLIEVVAEYDIGTVFPIRQPDGSRRLGGGLPSRPSLVRAAPTRPVHHR